MVLEMPMAGNLHETHRIVNTIKRHLRSLPGLPGNRIAARSIDQPLSGLENHRARSVEEDPPLQMVPDST